MMMTGDQIRSLIVNQPTLLKTLTLCPKDLVVFNKVREKKAGRTSYEITLCMVGVPLVMASNILTKLYNKGYLTREDIVDTAGSRCYRYYKAPGL